MRQWVSNYPQILDQISISRLHASVLDLGSNQYSKALGLQWNPKLDVFKYNITEDNNKSISKRSILSSIAQIFDPLGIVSPVTVQAKVILQKLWQIHVSWDESIPISFQTQWKSVQSSISDLNDIEYPRFVLCDNLERVELHGFSDASSIAYSGCIYVRTVDKLGNISVKLLAAKTRVAPLKTVTIPRLELCGALVLARLVNKIVCSLKIPFDKITFWCDSTIALCWIQKPTR